MDAKFNATNTSQYNIYDKCYRGKNDSSGLKYVNTGCEDEAGLMTYLNDPQVQQNWNIKDTREWKPCNNKVFAAYLSSGKNCYFLLPELIKSHLRIVTFLSYSVDLLRRSWLQSPNHFNDQMGQTTQRLAPTSHSQKLEIMVGSWKAQRRRSSRWVYLGDRRIHVCIS